MSAPVNVARVRHSIAKQTAAWPKDILRPQVQFSTCLQSLVDARLGQIEQGQRPLDDEERATIDSLQRGLRDLMNNKWRNKYPLTEKSLMPASKPTYYFRMHDGIDRAQRGEAKPWWRTFFGLEAAGLQARIDSGELDARIGLRRAVPVKGKAA